MTKFNWTEEATKTLIDAVAGVAEVSQEQQEQLAEQLGTNKRSVGSKLRSLVKSGTINVEVAKAAPRTSQWSDEETAELEAFVNENANAMTYAEIAATFKGGKWTPKKIQGKLLSMDLSKLVAPAPEKEKPAKSYTEAEEAQIIEMQKEGKFMEEIAEALGKSVESVRGKCLSLLRSVEGFDTIPATRDRKETARVDEYANLNLEEMTVAQIATETGKTERAVKSALTRRGIKAVDYDGEKKAAKRAEKKAAASE